MKSKLFFPIPICIALMCIVSCTNAPDNTKGTVKPSGSQTITVTTYELKNSSQVIPFANVTEFTAGVGAELGRTGSNGSILLEVTPSSTFSFNKANFEETRVDFIATTNLLKLDVFLDTLHDSGTHVAMGTVRNENNQLIENVTVTCCNGNGNQSTRTDALGHFLINSTSNPPFLMSFEKDSIVTTLSVSAQDTANIVLDIDGIIFDSIEVKTMIAKDPIKSKE